jgi:hypothetical protein
LPENQPDVAPYGAQNSLFAVLSHGWLAMGYMTTPATRAFGQRWPLF